MCNGPETAPRARGLPNRVPLAHASAVAVPHAEIARPRRAVVVREVPEPPGRPVTTSADPLRPALTVAHDGWTVLLCRPNGAIEADREGLYDLDCRILSRHVLQLDGAGLEPVGSPVAEASRWSGTLIQRRPGASAAGPELPQDNTSLEIARVVGSGMTERITLVNNSMADARVRLSLTLDADFRDSLDRGGEGPPCSIEVSWDADLPALSFRGVTEYGDHVDERGTWIRVTGDGPPAVESSGDVSPGARTLTWSIDLRPHGRWTVDLAFDSLREGGWRRAGPAPERAVRREAWSRARTRVEDAGAVVGPAFERAADDLLALRNWDLEPTADGSAWLPNAGVPWFTGLFGRDVLTSAWQAAMLGPEMARGALEAVAASQGQRDDPFTEEQPGRMIHEMRRGPLAALGIRPHARYYGTQTSPSMFILTLSEAWHWTGDLQLLRRHRAAAQRAIAWSEQLGDLDGDGFLEYVQRSSDGLKNQGWKDSDEAIRYPDGSIVENPIATVDEQAFHYLAMQRMAEILVALDEEADEVERLLGRADALRAAWDRAFWLPDEGFYAVALDPDKRRVASITSDPIHALGAGMIPRERAREIADRLLAPDLFSGWGIRTLSIEHPSYNPFAYHLGAVWPVENATAALGFKRYGFDDHVERLASGLVGAIAHCAGGRLPEALTGHDRAELDHPLAYPGGNSPQAWSAGATIQLVQALLGIYPFAPAGLLALVRPRLPAWLPTLTLRKMRVGDATVSIRFERNPDGSAGHEVIEQDGHLLVMPAPPPDAEDLGPLEGLASVGLQHAPGRLGRALRIALGLEGGSPA
jgi:glycogen debranching enzyme